MPLRLPSVLVLFSCLAVILQCSSQLKPKVLTEVTDHTPSTTEQAPAKPSVLQTTNQVLRRTSATRSIDGHTVSQRETESFNSENTGKTQATTFLVTTKSAPPTSPMMHTLITSNMTVPVTEATIGHNTSHPAATATEATISPNTSHTTVLVTEATLDPNTSNTTLHTTVSVTEATIGHITSHTATPVTDATTTNSSTIPGSWSPIITTPHHTTRTSPSNTSHTTGETTQPSNQTTLPATLSTSPHNRTTSQEPTSPTRTPGPTTPVHNVTQTTSPATKAPGPTLSPQPSSAKIGIYQVFNGSRLCIKAEMAIELIVQDVASVFSPKRYFNIDPNATHASGNCGSRKSDLLLTFQGGIVNFTFTKDENSYYISEVGAYLIVSNPEKTYRGMKSALMMFETVAGHSFKCVSEQSVQLSSQLQLKTMNVQLQAFDFEGVHFGNADECFSDRNRREIPVAVGLSIAGLFVVLLTACLVARKRPSRGYELDECSSDYTVVLPVIGAIVLGLCAVGLIVYGIRLRREASGYQRI